MSFVATGGIVKRKQKRLKRPVATKGTMRTHVGLGWSACCSDSQCCATTDPTLLHPKAASMSYHHPGTCLPPYIRQDLEQAEAETLLLSGLIRHTTYDIDAIHLRGSDKAPLLSRVRRKVDARLIAPSSPDEKNKIHTCSRKMGCYWTKIRWSREH